MRNGVYVHVLIQMIIGLSQSGSSDRKGWNVTLGLIRDGRASHGTRTSVIAQCDVTVVSHVTDFTDAFQVYKAVKQLEHHDKVDTIVVVNSEKLGRVEDAIFNSGNTPLVYWGQRPLYTWVQYL